MMIASTIEPHRPIRNFEEWKNLRRDLNQQPAYDGVCNRDLVNIAPLQFGENRRFVTHRLLGPNIFSTSAPKRGLPFSESNSGSTLMYLKASPAPS